MTQALESAAARIEEYLAEEGVSKIAPTVFVAKRGSAVVGIRVLPYDDEDHEDETMVEVRANVVEGASLNVGLLRQLLEFNDEAAYGCFGIGEAGLITYHHCLLGSSLAQRELLDVVHEVAKVSDDRDDVIIEQAGGQTAVDKLRELRAPKAQPTIEAPRASDPSDEQAE
jgi:Fe-S cluster assembly iron-binding protein IscA